MNMHVITKLAPALLALVVIDANAGIVPYNSSLVPYKAPASLEATAAEYDQNGDSFITADEVEVELRENAVNKAIAMQKKGKSQEAIASVVENMEDSIEQDAEAIIDKLDTDGDELVEPNEVNKK